jgi:hypothetical protein
MATIIALHDRLTDLRGTIESMAAQRRSLSKQAALSTITLTLQQAAFANPVPKDPNWMGQSWAEATTSLGGLLRGGVSILIWLLVFCPFWIPVLWLGIKGIRGAGLKKVEV